MGDAIREVRRAVLPALKADATLTALVPSARIYPSTVPASPAFPFTRWDGASSLPITEFLRGAEVSFMVHAFAKPRYSGAAMVETAEDHAGRITSALYGALHRQRFALPGGATFAVRAVSSRLMQDGAETDAYHGIVNAVARVLASV
jgi:hypothetical protein